LFIISQRTNPENLNSVETLETACRLLLKAGKLNLLKGVQTSQKKVKLMCLLSGTGKLVSR